LATQYLSPDSNVLSAGYYDVNNLSSIDSDLNSASILSGVEIFGVEGSASAGSSDPGYYAFGSGQVTCANESGWVADCGSVSGTFPGQDANAYGSDFVHDWVDNGDGTVSDNTTGLMWMKGQSSENLTWGNALLWCDNNTLVYDDWRLPNILEIVTMFDYNSGGGAKLTAGGNAFDSTFNNYWSSTSHPSDPDLAYYLSSNGSIYNDYKGLDSSRARCVRFED